MTWFVLRQAAELTEYSNKIMLLEEAKRAKEEEAETWHSKVRRTVHLSVQLKTEDIR